jgi:hypothetical protein
MPQLVKGGKWVFGWVIVGPRGQVRIPPAAIAEYGFQVEDIVFLARGSRRSGGFGIGRLEKVAKSPLQARFTVQAKISKDGDVALPPEMGIRPGERLLVVRGSGLALSFVQYGPIFETVLKHPDIETFGGSMENDPVV